MKNNNFEYKSSDISRRQQGKRMLANYEACKVELKRELGIIFDTFNQTLEKTTKIMLEFPPQSRSRTLEASIIQSCFAEMLFKNFGDKAFYGKHKRLILKVKGYIILFKKLDRRGLPMNITTTNVQSILNQNRTLDLFSESDYNDEPLLYFGYKKNKLGALVDPQLIYIDEEEVKFSITEDQVGYVKSMPIAKSERTSNVQLKITVDSNKVVNNK